MNKDKKALVLSICLLVAYAVIGVVVGGFVFDNIENIPPVVVFLGCLALLIFAGLGAGINALAKLTRLNSSPLFCYLPIAQDTVVYNVVRGIKTTSKLHEILKKFNFLVTSTVLIIVGCIAPIISQSVIGNMLETNAGNPEIVEKILGVNTIVITVVSVILIVAYVVRVLYFNYIFKLTYKSPLVRILAILPPFHLIFIAILPNQISYLLNTGSSKKKR